MLRWLRGTMGGSAAGMNAMMGALDSVFNPGAARAREELEAQNHRVIPVPSPGDKLLDEGRVVIRRKPEPEPKPEPDAEGLGPGASV
jgi:hypothetical protein